MKSKWVESGTSEHTKAGVLSAEGYAGIFGVYRAPTADRMATVFVPGTYEKPQDNYVAIMGFDFIREGELFLPDIFLRNALDSKLKEFYLRNRHLFVEVGNLTVHPNFTKSAPALLCYSYADNAIREGRTHGIALSNRLASMMFDSIGVPYEQICRCDVGEVEYAALRDEMGIPEEYLGDWIPSYFKKTKPWVTFFDFRKMRDAAARFT